MKLLVTGGAGFIGSNYIHHLLEEPKCIRPQRITVLDKLTYAGNKDNLKKFASDDRLEIIEGDICDQALLVELLNTRSPDAVVHFAAESHVDRSIDSPEPFFQTNVVGTLRLLDACRSYWKKDKKNFRFHHISTDEVYGSLGMEEPAFSEQTPYAPNSPYAASKAASDHIIRSFHHTYGFPAITTNCSNNYGPFQFPEKLIPLIILTALDRKPLPIYGDGMNIRDWLYVRDHCTALELVLAQGQLGETYNIGGCCEMTNLAVVDGICGLLDELKPSDMGSYVSLKTFVSDRPGHDRRYAINCAKIMNELGWRPQESFISGLRKTVEWYLANRAWCESIQQKKYRLERLGLNN